MKSEAVAAAALFLGLGIATARAEQPYIDQVRKTLPAQEPMGASDQPYLDSLRKSLAPSETAGSGEQPYIDQVKKHLPETSQGAVQGASYTEEQRAKLPAKESGGAIQAVLEGKSALKPRYVGTIHHAFGLTIGASVVRDITASAGTMLRAFDDVYGGNYVPSFTFFYEYQLFHDEVFGSLGLLGSAGGSYFHGTGTFKVDLVKPWAPTQTFGLGTNTLFQFFTFPVSVALNYRLNLLKYVRPFAVAGPMLIGYSETRGDPVPGNHGYSKAIYTAAGISILMDWVAPRDAWDSYKDFSIRHAYLTLEYGRVSTFSSDVIFANSGVFAGVTFEY